MASIVYGKYELKEFYLNKEELLLKRNFYLQLKLDEMALCLYSFSDGKTLKIIIIILSEKFCSGSEFSRTFCLKFCYDKMVV